MTTDEVLKELEGYGDEGTKNTFLKHGAREPSLASAGSNRVVKPERR